MTSIKLKLRITRVTAPDAIGSQIEPKFRNLMDAMGRRAQRLVPKRTWALHDTIAVEVERNGALLHGTMTAGGGPRNVAYAVWVELGTSRMAAQPYLRPAMLQTRGADFDCTGGLAADHGTQAATRKLNRATRAPLRRRGA